MKNLTISLAIIFLVSCGTEDPTALINSKNNTDADTQTCTVKQSSDHAKITCPDGTTAKVLNGSDGVDGAEGADGSDGKNGSKGAAGKKGKDGTNGTDGLAGTNGTDGASGTNGTNGTNGTDATVLNMYTKDAVKVGKVVGLNHNSKASVQLSNGAILGIGYGSNVVITAGTIALYYASTDCTGAPKFVPTNNQASNLFYSESNDTWYKAIKGTSSVFSYNSRLNTAGSCGATTGTINIALDVSVIDMSAYASWLDYSTVGQPKFSGAPFYVMPE